MSELGLLSRGGASSIMMFFVGINCLACCMIAVCVFLVWVGVRAGLCFVCLASLVRVCMMMMSCGLKVSCLMVLSVWGRVNVG